MAYKIVALADAAFAIPALRAAFADAWAPWYGPGGQGDADLDLRSCMNTDRLPTAVAALDDAGAVLGTAALKPESLGSELGYGPWLAAVLVLPPYRRRGIGSALIAAIEDRGRQLQFDAIFTSTDTANALVERRGWVSLGRQVESLRGPVMLYRCDLA
ncbi:MAG: GNAT family N-acetyltransferase [Alphaproteobacteria bacterium]